MTSAMITPVLKRRIVLLSALSFALAPQYAFAQAQPATVKVAAFAVDASPPIGYDMSYSKVVSIEDPLSARGLVILSAEAPVVLMAVDWIALDGLTRDAWQKRLAQAAGTTPDRVSIHVLHQHEAPGGRLGVSSALEKRGLDTPRPAGEPDPKVFIEQTIAKSTEALKASLLQSKPVTHIGTSQALVERVAANRRLLGPDGKVTMMLQSSWNYNPRIHQEQLVTARRNGYRLSPDYPDEARNAPEGVIDPYVKILSFWNGDQPVAALSYYATHPQLTLGTGVVRPDFVGLARTRREAETGAFHLHFNGAGGNISLGKYNDATPEALKGFTERMTDALTRAWNSTKKQPIAASDVEWRSTTVRLPTKFTETPAQLRSIADDTSKTREDREAAVRKLVLAERVQETGIELHALRLGDTYSVYMPSELFVEYQLAAQKMRPQNFVTMAAYGEAISYIGTAKSYWEGGYEPITASQLNEKAEPILLEGMKTLLR